MSIFFIALATEMSHRATSNSYAEDFTSIRSIVILDTEKGDASSRMFWAPSLISVSAVLSFFLIFISRTKSSTSNLKPHFLRLLCSSRNGIALCDFAFIGLNKPCICKLQ